MTTIHLYVYLQRKQKQLSIRMMQVYEKLPEGLPEWQHHFHHQDMAENRGIQGILITQYGRLSGRYSFPVCDYFEDDKIERELNQHSSKYTCQLRTLPLSADIRECLLMVAAVDAGLEKFQQADSHVYYLGALPDFNKTIDIIHQAHADAPQAKKMFSRECAAWLIEQLKEFQDELVEYQHIRLILEAMLRVEQGSLSDAIQQFLQHDPSVEDTRPEYMKLLPQPIKHITPEELKKKRVEVNQFIENHPAENGLQALTNDVLKFSIVREQGLNLQDVKNLSMTCTAMRGLFQPEIEHRVVTRLLLHVVHGEQAEAEKMIIANPRLLLLSASVIDYSGRKIQSVTALQCAFGAKDIAMYDMLLSHLLKLDGGGKAAFKQVNDKFTKPSFPDYSDDEIFVKLAVSIDKDPCHDKKVGVETQHLLDVFRRKFKPGVIETGYHFDMRNLLAAITAYQHHCDKWNENQCRLYWNQVMGYLERLLPANVAQDLCQGLVNVIENHEPSKRSLKLFNGDAYYPLDADSFKRLGYDFAVYSVYIFNHGGFRFSRPGHTVVPDLDQAKTMYDNLLDFCRTKTLALSQRRLDLKQYESCFEKCTIC